MQIIQSSTNFRKQEVNISNNNNNTNTNNNNSNNNNNKNFLVEEFPCFFTLIVK